MTNNDRRTFTHEFKEQVFQLILNRKSTAAIVHEHGIHLSNLNRWIQQYQATGSFKQSSNRIDQQNELIALQKRKNTVTSQNWPNHEV